MKMKKQKNESYHWSLILLIALCLWAFFIFLDWINLPSWIFAKIGLPEVFNFFKTHQGAWGNVITFFAGIILGILIQRLPDMIKDKTFDNSQKILDYIRGNLTDFKTSFEKVISILDDIENDENSCFIIASQMPVLGADLEENDKNLFRRKLSKRISDSKKTRIISCSPYKYDEEKFEFVYDMKNSAVGEFCKYLAEYQIQPEYQNQKKRSQVEIFNDVEAFFRSQEDSLCKNTDIIILDSIPYQIFLGKKSNNERKCVFLLSGAEAIKYKLPSGGFFSEEKCFIDMVEKSLNVLFGNNCQIYELQQLHSKTIEEKWKQYSQEFTGVGSTQLKEHNAKLKKITISESALIKDYELAIYPNVFNPRDADSGTVMLEAIKNCVNDKVELVIDIGCGSGSLTIAAIKAGAKEVAAVDINPYAVECTKYNCELSGCSDKVTVYESNLFEKLEERKDEIKSKKVVIIADLPFINKYVKPKEPKDWIGIALYDFMFKVTERFLHKAKGYLSDEGKICVSFSSLDSVNKFEELIKKEGYEVEYKNSILKNSYYWYYYILTK